MNNFNFIMILLLLTTLSILIGCVIIALIPFETILKGVGLLEP